MASSSDGPEQKRARSRFGRCAVCNLAMWSDQDRVTSDCGCTFHLYCHYGHLLGGGVRSQCPDCKNQVGECTVVSGLAQPSGSISRSAQSSGSVYSVTPDPVGAAIQAERQRDPLGSSPMTAYLAAGVTNDNENDLCITVATRASGEPKMCSMTLEDANPPAVGSRSGSILGFLFQMVGSIVARSDAARAMLRAGSSMLQQVKDSVTLTHVLVYGLATGNGADALAAAQNSNREARLAAAGGEVVLNTWGRSRRGPLKLHFGRLAAGSGASKSFKSALENHGLSLKSDNLWNNYGSATEVGVDDGVTDTRIGDAIRELYPTQPGVMKHDNLGFKRGAAAGRNGYHAWMQIVEINFDQASKPETKELYTMFLKAKAEAVGLLEGHAAYRRKLPDIDPDFKKVIGWEDRLKGDSQQSLNRIDQVIEWASGIGDVTKIKLERPVQLPNLVNMETVDPGLLPAGGVQPVQLGVDSQASAGLDDAANELDDAANEQLEEELAAARADPDRPEANSQEFIAARSLHVRPLKEDLNAVATVMIICKYRIRVHFGLLMRLAKGDIGDADKAFLREQDVDPAAADCKTYVEFISELGCWISCDGSPAYTTVQLATQPHHEPWRSKVAEAVNADHPDLEQTLGYKLDEVLVGELVSDIVDGKLHWLVELFGLKGPAFWSAHLQEPTAMYRTTPGRQDWIKAPSLPRQARMEFQEASAAQTIACHGALTTAIDDLEQVSVAALGLLLGQELGELQLAANESEQCIGEAAVTAEVADARLQLRLRYAADGFAGFCAVSSRDDIPTAATPAVIIAAGLASFAAAYVCAEDVTEWYVWRAFDEPGVMPLYHEYRYGGAALNMLDTERRYDATAVEPQNFRDSQAVAAMLVATRHAYKYALLYIHTVMQHKTASSFKRAMIDKCLFARMFGKHGTFVFLDRGQEWNMELIRHFEGHQDRGGNKFAQVDKTISQLTNLTKERHKVGPGAAGDEADLNTERKRGLPFLTSQAFPAHVKWLSDTNAMGPGPLRSFSTGKVREQHGNVSLAGVKLEPGIAEYPTRARAAIDGYIDEIFYKGEKMPVGKRFPNLEYTEDDRVSLADAETKLFTCREWRVLGQSGRKSGALCKDAKFLDAENTWRRDQAVAVAAHDDMCDAAVVEAQADNGDTPLTKKEVLAAKVCAGRKKDGGRFPDSEFKWSSDPDPEAAAAGPTQGLLGQDQLLQDPFYKTHRRQHSRPYNRKVTIIDQSDREELAEATAQASAW